MLRTARRFSSVVLTSLAVVGLPTDAVEPSKSLAEGQVGRIHFQSVTITNPQFLRGMKDTIPAVVWGDLELPREPVAQNPAIVLVHGSDGIIAGYRDWARELRAIGVASFLMDSFSGRGISETYSDQTRLGHFAMLWDAYRALELLATHPRIDPARIGIMGWSKGGIVSLYASVKRFQRLGGLTGAEFAIYLPFYPSCNTRYVGDEDVSERPIRIFHGAADDQTPLAPCRDRVEQLRAAGRNIEIIGYPGAVHGFDSTAAPATPQVFANRQNFSRCFFDEAKPHPDLKAYLGSCRSWGVTIGYDSRAHRDARQKIKEVLIASFRLPH